jgi:putative flippase GtrA
MRNNIEKMETDIEVKSDVELESHAEVKKVQADAPQKRGLAALWQFIKFGLVGVSNTVVSYVTYTIVYYVFRHQFGDATVHIANVAGFIISVLNAYIWQSRFVFKESEDGEHRVWWQVLLKTYASYAFSGLLLTELLLLLWIQVLNIGQYLGPLSNWLGSFGIQMQPEDLAVSIAPFLNMVITIPINFCINKFWAYRQKKV